MTKLNICRIVVIFNVFLGGCKTREIDGKYWTSSVDRYIKSSLGNQLTVLIKRIEFNDVNAWNEFASLGSGLDGEHGEVYSVACAELARRDPTFYLRRYLTGDYSAIPCAKKAYGWSGSQGRSLLDAVYAERLYIANNPEERKAIQSFIAKTAVWKEQ